MDFFGHGGVLSLIRAWLEEYVSNFDFSIRLSGENEDVAYFVYPDTHGKRVYLVNTDWTVAGNVKECVLHSGDESFKVKVEEGVVGEVVVG